jgi:peptidoglycan/LPS O-acetylase OafA/YrhL
LYFIGFLTGAITSGVALVLGQGVLDFPGYLTALLSGMLMLPSPTWNQDAMAVPFNYPAWSLICEIALNLIYVATWRWWRLPALLTVAVMAGSALCLIGWRYGTTGYGTYWELYWIGYVRVLFSFVTGVAIRRVYTGRLTYSRSAWCVPLLPLLLFVGGGGVAGELAVVLLLIPLLVYVAAHIEPVGGRRIFVLLGAVSYPFYAIHIPVIQLVERAATVLHLALASFAPWIGILLCALIIAAALALDRWYDKPARGWLTKHLARST